MNTAMGVPISVKAGSESTILIGTPTSKAEKLLPPALT
jgi:hypothetical protein